MYTASSHRQPGSSAGRKIRRPHGIMQILWIAVLSALQHLQSVPVMKSNVRANSAHSLESCASGWRGSD